MAQKILLIEDDLNLCQICRVNLEKAGFAVEEAHDGKLGLTFALTHKPALILLDLMLPGMNGLEILNILKGNQTTSQIPVLVLTNLPEGAGEAKSLGAKACLLKAELTPEELVVKIRETLDN